MMKLSAFWRRCRSERGQGLVEYLIIVAIVAVGAISIMRVMGQSINTQLSRITSTLQNKPGGKATFSEVTETHWKKRDLGNFFKGAVSGDKD